MSALKSIVPTRPNPNQLSDDEHEQLFNDPPPLDYKGCEGMIRDWIMQYEGYDLFKQILLGSGVTEVELAYLEGPTEGPPSEARRDELHDLFKAAEDRAYLIVLIKLYQVAVNWAPRQNYPTRKVV